MIRLRKGFIIFVFMYDLCSCWICWFSLWHGKRYTSPWVTSSLTRLGRRSVRKHIVRSNTICPIMEYLAREEYKAKAGHASLFPRGSSQYGVRKSFVLGGKTNLAHIVSSRSTMVEHGGVVGKLDHESLHARFSLWQLASTKDLFQRQNYVVMP